MKPKIILVAALIALQGAMQVGCCAGEVGVPYPLNKDRFIESYIILSDSLIIDSDDVYLYNKDSASNDWILSIRSELSGWVVSEGHRYEATAKEIGDTLFIGEYVVPVGKIPLDPIKDVSIKSISPYRGSKDMDELFDFYADVYPNDLIPMKKESKEKYFEKVKGENRCTSYKNDHYRTKDIIYGDIRDKVSEFSKSKYSETFRSERLHFRLETPPYKSGNYEFEITATTKSGKVLKTKTAPVYLVGENE